MNKEILYSIYEYLGISQLVLIYLSNITEEKTSNIIKNIIYNRLSKYHIFQGNSLLSKEIESIKARIEEQKFIFKLNTTPTDLFSFFFNYITSNNIDHALLDELIIARFFPKFITKEINNIDKRIISIKDKNSKKTLFAAKAILNNYANFEYEDIYHFIYENNPNYYRKMKYIDNFIQSETKIMFSQAENLFCLLDTDYVDYENENIYKHLNIKEGKVLKFKRK
jgi:hypothetical protein